MANKLPDNWAIVPMGHIFTLIRGVSYNKQDSSSVLKNDYLPILRANNISDGTINFDKLVFVHKKYVNDEQMLQVGDIVIAMSSGSKRLVGKAAPLTKQWNGSFGAFCSVARPFKSIDDKYLNHFFQSNIYRDNISIQSSGININNIRKEYFDLIQIPLPSRTEQKKISDSLHILFGNLNSVKSKLEYFPNFVADFRQQILSHAISGKLTKDWRLKNTQVEPANLFLKNLIIKREKQYHKLIKLYKKKKHKKPDKDFIIDYKRHKSISTWSEAKLDNLIYIAGRIGWRGLKADEYSRSGALFLSVYNLNRGKGYEIKYDDSYYVPMGRYNESPEIQLTNDDILLVKDGAGIGKVGIIKNLPQKATVNSSLLLIRAKEAFIPEYLLYFLAGPKLQELAKSRISGTAIPHLFQKDIKEFVLSVPPIAEQKEIIKRVKYLLNQLEIIESKYFILKSLFEDLPQQILKKAFSGKLIPQNPNDEPIEILLDNIRKEKDAMVKEQGLIKKKKQSKINDRIIMEDTNRKDLFDIIKSFPDGISPEELLKKANYDSKDISDFYKNLKSIRDKIVEVKPENSKRDWPNKTSVILKPKGK